MSKQIILFLLAIILVATVGCKKKKEVLPTTMTVVVNKDTVWTTSNVTTDNSNVNVIYISAANSDNSSTMDLALTGYKGIKGKFLVDYRGPGGNMTGNTGMYRNGNVYITARSGNISVTEVTNTLIKGTFELYEGQTIIKGSFAAPAH